MGENRIAWGITGAGDKINKIIEEMEKAKEDYPVNIHVFVSKAGEQVLKWYHVYKKVKEAFDRFTIERNANTPFLAGNLQTGDYEGLLIAPATSNTVAKIALSIGDTLLTNSALMALKAFVPVHIMPVDMESGEIVTELPNGGTLRMRVREEDAQNVEKLREIDGINIIEKPENIRKHIEKLIE
ncbi:hypothetical protein AKJ51_02430 [candidate division MSBL1 archaeon SCGC-AAA382A20]|uniref:Flavoprotein domain-containing protein n=1 Tax=candidate division MSBL1 archaeon SCGC-AAA382A20 TaxID=1698280 RepID=A0A133VKG4_9EURY|nr:hypothetical protein AKJ51_02430 [candidate division MSBL1 archaeon SCGC-AAA382A20]